MANLNLTSFEGLDTLHTPAGIKDDSLVNLLNFDLTKQGYLQKRTGLSKFDPDDGRGLILMGRYKTASFDRIITYNGTDRDLDYMPVGGGSLTSINNAMPVGTCHIAQYADLLYIQAFSGDPGTYDGTTYTALPGKPAGTKNLFHKDREWIIDSVGGPRLDQLRYSEIAGSGGTDFSAANHPAANTILVGRGDGQHCSNLVVFNDVLYVFKSGSTWVLYTDTNTPEDWTLRQVEPTIGCTSKDGAVVHENLLYFLSINGVFRTDGTTFEEISAPIRDFFANRSLPTLLYDLIFEEFIAVVGDQLWCIVWDNSGSVGANSFVFIYNLKTKGWSQYTFKLWDANADVRTPVSLNDQNPASLYLGTFALSAGTDHGYIFSYGTPNIYQDTSDSARNYESTFRTKMFDFGEPSTWKRMLDCTIDYFTKASAATWRWYYEDGVIATPTTLLPANTTSTADNSRSLMPVTPAGWFRSIQAEFSDALDNDQCIIYGFTFNTSERKISGRPINQVP